MKTKTVRRKPEIILRDGKPSAVILDINNYHEMLERLEDKEDLEDLEKNEKTPVKIQNAKLRCSGRLSLTITRRHPSLLSGALSPPIR